MSALKKHKRTNKVHYISLKPFSKKERRRQKLLAASEVGSYHLCPLVLLTPPLQMAEKPMEGSAMPDDEDEAEEEEDFVPRSPVALPDASTCKSILVGLGFALTERSKKGRCLLSSIAVYQQILSAVVLIVLLCLFQYFAILTVSCPARDLQTSLK